MSVDFSFKITTTYFIHEIVTFYEQASSREC